MISNVRVDNASGDLVAYDKSNNEIARLDGTNRTFITQIPHVRSLYRRVTTAEVNAGVTLLAAIAGYKYRLVDITLVAIGGNAGTATAVTVSGTQSSSVVALITAAVAALTRSTAVKPNTANVTLLTDGVSFVQNDANAAITMEKTGGSLATATAIDVTLNYTLEAA
jgi:hypothetical protein